MSSDYKLIAHIEKAHGKRGEFVAASVHGLPPLLHEGMRVAVVPPRLKGDRFHVVERASDDGSRASQLVAISGVSDLDAAEGLRGRYLLARREDLPADVELMDAEAMVGRTVTDERTGVLGRVCEVIRTPAHDVWQVVTSSGELLLPVVDAIGARLSGDGEVSVSVPEGMMGELMGELSRGEGDEA